MSKTLGGTVFIRNAIDLDYCIAECLQSMCAVCDRVIVLDAGSTDGTLDLLATVAHSVPPGRLKIVHGEWGPEEERYLRLSRLLNTAKEHLDTDWYLMMQGDEVLHEDGFEVIRNAVQRRKARAYLMRRLNLWGDLNHCIRFDLPHGDKPTADQVLRLGRIEYLTHGDGDHLLVPQDEICREHLDAMPIFHYGFVRDDRKQIKRIQNTPGWFWGPGSPVDSRLEGMTEVFDWRKWHPKEHLMPIPKPHPKYSRAWAEEHQKTKTIPV